MNTDRRNHRVLVALPQQAYPRLSPARCRLLAVALAGDLHVLTVLRVLPNDSPTLSARQRMNAERSLFAGRKTRAWCKSVLGKSPPATQLHVRIGAFIPEVAAGAAAVDAALIVLPHHGEDMGAIAVTLAREALRPVLVVKQLMSRNALLAALDLDDEYHPVLQFAESLAAELDAQVVAMHNVDSSTSLLDEVGDEGQQREHAYVLQPAPCTQRAALSPGTTMLLTQNGDTAETIVREARTYDVNTIMVGVRPPSWLDRAMGQDVVARVVDRTERSVLIVPLPSPDCDPDWTAGVDNVH